MTDDELLDLEERWWQALSTISPKPFCEKWLADDAVIVVPGMVIDRTTFLDAVTNEQPWSTHHIRDPRVVRLSVDSAALVYEVTACRDGQTEFTGTLTTVYANRKGGWRLVLHQQTPVPKF
jgi:hypothetical protein